MTNSVAVQQRRFLQIAPDNNLANANVNQNFEWSDVNYADNYRFELSTVEDFSSLVKDEKTFENEKNILISAHGNSIRAMIKLFENIDDDSIDKLEVPTGEPIFYKYQSKNLIRN